MTQKLDNIQALRAYAAVSVVFFHAFKVLDDHNRSSAVFDIFGGLGASGVDIFFVISGFIMVYIQGDRSPAIVRFLKDRLFRIISIYWPLSLLMIVFPMIGIAHGNSTSHIAASFLFVSQILGEEFPILGVGWTLEFEVLFYIIFSLSLVFRDIRYTVFSTSLLLLAIIIISGQVIIALEFIFGMVIGLMYRRCPSLSSRIGWSTFSLGFLLLMLSVFVDVSEQNRAFLWGVPAALIVFGALYMQQIKNSTVILVGDASYSIYLTHTLYVPVFYRLVYEFVPFGPWNDLIAVFAIISAVLIGVAFYSVCESKILNWYKRKRQPI